MNICIIFITLFLIFGIKPTCQASDQVSASGAEMALELAIRNLPLLDHSTICTLAVINRNLRSNVMATKQIRKETLVKSADGNKALCNIKYASFEYDTNGEYIYFNCYGSVCIYFTYVQSGDYPELYCHWTVSQDRTLRHFAGTNPIMKPHTGFAYCRIKSLNCWKIGDGLPAYGMGHYLEGPYMLEDNNGFRFLDNAYSCDKRAQEQHNKIYYHYFDGKTDIINASNQMETHN